MFPRITAFLEPLKKFEPYVDEDGDVFNFYHTLKYALDVYPQEFDNPADPINDDPQKFADAFLGDVLFPAYEEDSPEYRQAMFQAFVQVCQEQGIKAEVPGIETVCK